MNLDTVFREGTGVTYIVLIAVEELDEGLRVGEISELGLVDTLTELAPHRIQQHLSQGTCLRVLFDLGGVEMNPFPGIVSVDVSLFLDRRGAPLRPSAGFFFDFEPRVQVRPGKSRSSFLEMPHFVDVGDCVPFLYGHL